MADLISRSALEKKVEEMYRKYRNDSAMPVSGGYLMKEGLMYAATVSKAILDMINDAPTTTEKEIREQAITEFAERIKPYAFGKTEIIDKIATELKGE